MSFFYVILFFYLNAWNLEFAIMDTQEEEDEFAVDEFAVLTVAPNCQPDKGKETPRDNVDSADQDCPDASHCAVPTRSLHPSRGGTCIGARQGDNGELVARKCDAGSEGRWLS